MRPMSEPTPLGRLLKARRQKRKISWKRLEKAVGVEDQTMMRWERGVTKDPPIGKVLLYAREVGITLEELEAVVLPSVGHADPDVVEAAKVLPARPRERKPRPPIPRSRRRAQPSPEE